MVILQTFFHQSTKINTDQRSWRQHLTTIRNELSRKCRIESNRHRSVQNEPRRNKTQKCAARGEFKVSERFLAGSGANARARAVLLFFIVNRLYL